jgi:hypothetical protein
MDTATEERCFLCRIFPDIICRTVGAMVVVGQFPPVKNVSREAENIVEIRHYATTGEDTADREKI